MSEKAPNIENKSQAERIEVHVNNANKLTHKEREATEKQKKAMEALARDKAEKLALKASEHQPKAKEETADDKGFTPNKSYRSIMARVESQLPTYQRVFSRFIRRPIVDKTNIIIGQTIARPSAVLGASATGFIGLAFFAFYARSVGFELPSSVFVLLVILGWVLGLVAELLFRSVGRLFRSSN